MFPEKNGIFHCWVVEKAPLRCRSVWKFYSPCRKFRRHLKWLPSLLWADQEDIPSNAARYIWQGRLWRKATLSPHSICSLAEIATAGGVSLLKTTLKPDSWSIVNRFSGFSAVDLFGRECRKAECIWLGHTLSTTQKRKSERQDRARRSLFHILDNIPSFASSPYFEGGLAHNLLMKRDDN